jgi:MtN3 and saliva related transmembrane protein
VDKASIELIGAIAVAIGLSSLVPQLIKTWRTRSAEDLSTTWLVLALISASFGLVYVLLLDAWAAIIGNALGIALTALLLAMKMRFRSKRPAADAALGHGWAEKV